LWNISQILHLICYVTTSYLYLKYFANYLDWLRIFLRVQMYLQLNGCGWRARHSRTFLNSGLAVEGKCCTKLLTRFKTLLWHRPLWMKLLCILSRDFAEFPADSRGILRGFRGVQTSWAGQMKLTLRPAVLAALT